MTASPADAPVIRRDVRTMTHRRVVRLLLVPSAEFDSIAKHMGTVLVRFERSTWQAAPSTRQR